jgi:RNA polymerase sigma factor (TIGR02999 family)
MDSGPKDNEITELLSRVSSGDHDAESRLLECVYANLRALARHYISAERRDHTLQATALVHEAYLRISQNPGFKWENRAHFFAVASRAMRRVLIDHARTVKAVKRGGVKVPLDQALVGAPEQSTDLLALDQVLLRLASLDARQAQIVEMRFFGGVSVSDIASALDISERTVKRDWTMARAWLHGELTKGNEIDGPDTLGEP